MSEVTRAEQLAETLEAKAAGQKNSFGDYWGDWVCRDAAAELRRLSAAEVFWSDHQQQAAKDLREARAAIARQSELIQQAKEAMAEAKNWMSWAKTELDKDIPTGEPVHPVSVKLTWPASSLALALSAINEWEKIK